MSARVSKLNSAFAGSAAIAVALSAMALAIPAAGQTVTPVTEVKKVVNGKYAVDVDNGWVLYQGIQGQPTVGFYVTDTDGNFTPSSSFKLKTAGNGQNGNGLFFNGGGVVFAPCTAPAPGKCAISGDGSSGVGIGFGQATFGGAGGAAGGWTSDSSFAAHVTNADQVSGSISGVAVDAANGAYAVGWDLNLSSFTNHAIIEKLDSAGQTFAPISKIDLGTLGGPTSQALAISKNAKYVVGIADTAARKAHAVYALSTATAWTDLTTAFPGTVIKSRALAVSNAGMIAGSATVKRSIAGKTKSVDIGFVYNLSTGNVKFFEAPGANVIPLTVLDDGRVVGNLEFLAPGAIKAYHPFLFDGTNTVDFGTMTVAGQPAFGCRVNRPNSLGELAGSCIANATTAYGIAGTAFYLNAVAASPAYVNVNTAVHAISDSSNAAIKPYVMGSVSAIDDQHEIIVIGGRTAANGTVSESVFLASKPGYNP